MPPEDDCVICKRQKADSAQTEGSDLVYACDEFVIRHSRETNIRGYLVIEARRHYLDLTEAGEEEAISYGKVLKSAMQLVRKLTSAERIYTFSLGEAVPHFHVHVIPRTDSLPRFFRGRNIMSYPLQPSLKDEQLAEVCQSLRYLVKTGY